MNETLNNPNEKMLIAFDHATKTSQVYMGMLERPRIFNNFENAAYFYREKAISTAREAIHVAVECNDEFTEVKAYKNLFDLLAFDMSVDGKKKLFAECYEPIINILQSIPAKGLQYYQLGHYATNLDIPSAGTFFEKAVELNNENILAEEIFTGNPQLVMHWLERYILDAEKNKQANEYEQLLNDLVKDSDNASDFYFKLAVLLKQQFKDRADHYFRLCIKAGYSAVVEDPTFFTEDYEAEFIEWFKNQLDSQNDIVKLRDICFAKLWESKEDGAFVRSKKLWAEALAEKDLAASCKAYGAFADEGFDWAENWLLDHIENKNAQDAIPDKIIEKWFKLEKKDKHLETCLGMLFVGGRCPELKGRKYYICASRYHLEKGEYVASLACFLKAFDSAEVDGTFDHAEYERELRNAVKSNYVSMITQVLSAKNLYSTANPLKIDTDSYSNFTRKKVNAADSLKLYFSENQFRETIFRGPDAKPCCTRYFLLQQMADISRDSDVEIFKQQEEALRNQARLELDDAIGAFDTMALFVWVTEHLYSESVNDNKAALSVLCKLIETANPNRLDIPYKVLLHYWHLSETDNKLLDTLLYWLFNDNKKVLDPWTEEFDSKTMMIKILESL